MTIVDSATRSQKDGGGKQRLLEGWSRGLCVVRCVDLRSNVLTVLDLDEVNVTLKNAEIFGSVLSGEGGSANGWRCW